MTSAASASVAQATPEVLAHGWEGQVAKDPQSPYVGGRTLNWLKVKVPHYCEGERGWEPQKAR